ncbi:protein phosphatase 2C domain-containing protein [Virgibacillus kekensis]|uniref:Protein phosphatase 2C domain-containing protein n=1 Tax=Virgibacillus kekensis TaxID=202261 RepID=A0ABV9DLG2_9BACI
MKSPFIIVFERRGRRIKVKSVIYRGVRELNEDSVILNDGISLYGVADGVSSITPFTSRDNLTGGYIASNEVRRYFEELSSYSNLRNDFSIINTRVQDMMKEYDIDLSRKEQLWGTALALIKITPSGIDFIQTGDCMILAIYQDDSVRPLTRVQTEPLEELAINKWRELIHKGIDKQEELKKYVKDILISNRNRSNTPDGYGVLNGDNDAIKYIEYGKINRNGLKHLIVTTDGLFPSKECVQESESYWDYLAHMILSRGLKQYAEDLIKLEDSDPECLRFPRLKKSDDKAGILIDF